MGTSNEGVGSLEEEAKKRRERIAALKKQREDQSSNGNDQAGKKESLPKPVFRSYRPIDDRLKEGALPETEPTGVEALVGDVDASDTAAKPEEVDIAQLAPRKPDWDLKRDLAARLERLERRTQRAIAELIRERLQREGQADVLVDAVSASAAAATQPDDDDD